MIRRLLFLFATAILLSTAARAQPAPKVPPTEPVTRSAADLDALRLLEAEGLKAAESVSPREVSQITFPSTIRVGITPYVNCSDWVNNGRPVTSVVEMELRDYVKNVIANEWVYTWPTESIRAGAVAIKMFAWWRINLTEQYPGVFRPEGVHVVDNTCDQVYFANSNRPPTNAAVDFTWPYRLHYNEYVQEIHYLAYDFQCAEAFGNFGGGWSRCLPQWTSKDMADQGASWQVIINQFYAPISIAVTKDILSNTNVLKNGNFTNGTQHWTVTGGAQGAAVNGGVFTFYRGSSGGAAILRQDVAAQVPSGAPMRVRVLLGNAGAVAKQVTIRILRSDGGATAGTCTFTVPPNVPTRMYMAWGRVPAAWTGLRLEISGDSADNTPGYLIDNVRLTYMPGAAPSENCVLPRPGVPVLVAPAAGLTYGRDFNVVLQEGADNAVPGYDAAFHIQIDNESNFSSPFFDNANALADLPTIPVSLPDGRWHIRARQFDGVSLYSGWTAGVRFTTSQLPQKPVLVAPNGDVPANGQSFIWMAANGAERYRINVKDAANRRVYTIVLNPAQANCSSVCTYPLGAGILRAGENYRWRVVARNSSGKVMGDFSHFRLVNSP